jgi:phage tail sheath protein FI
MPVTTSYPGLYLEELPSNAHSITAAPTSITVFVGYTHPFKTRTFNSAVQLFSFTDYEREFGGLYASRDVDSYVAHAVNQFFLNGGSNAYVVGLRARFQNPLGDIPRPTVPVGGVIFTGREPVDPLEMRVAVEPRDGGTGDISITYGNSIETYRGVSLDSHSPQFIEKVIGTTAAPVSSLVTVEAAAGGYGASFTGTPKGGTPLTNPPSGAVTTFALNDFVEAFAVDASLDKVDVFNLLCIPGVADRTVVNAALSFAERKLAFVIADPPPQAAADGSGALPTMQQLFETFPRSTNGAIYFPYLRVTNPVTSQPLELPPSGFVAGRFADNDLRNGVWVAPAGIDTVIGSTAGVVERGRMTDPRHGTLNLAGVNVLRDFRGIGTVIFGARTLVSANTAFEQWKYVPVRRMALFIEQSLLRNLTWAVFEPNDRPLWTALRTTVNDFMLSLYNQRAFQGDTPSQAFRVVCDETTTTQLDIDQGRVIILVAFRPLKPAEFVVIRIAQLAGQSQS